MLVERVLVQEPRRLWGVDNKYPRNRGDRLHGTYLIFASRDDEFPALCAQVPRAKMLEHGGDRSALPDIPQNAIAVRHTR